MTFPDRLISADLAELAAHARRAPRPLPAHLSGLSGLADLSGLSGLSGLGAGAGAAPYRDDGPSARARRDELRQRRQRELAMLPPTLSRVFAGRVARAAAGAAGLLGAAGVTVVLADPGLLRLTARAWPGVNLTLVVALTTLATLVAYVGGQRLAQRLFTDRVQRAIPLAGEVHDELDHLARGPLERGLELVRQADRWSISLAVAGVVALGSVLGYAVTLIGTRHGWSAPLSLVVSRDVSSDLLYLVAAVVMFAGFAFRLGQACDREPVTGKLPCWARWLASCRALPAGILLSALLLAATVEALGQAPGSLPLIALSALAFATSLALTLTCAFLIWRRREQAALQAAVD